MRPLSWIYLLSAVVGAGTALYFGGPYWLSPGASLSDFGAQAFANAPAATLGADVAVLYGLVSLWIVVEGRRRGMRHLWLYLLANTLLAVAVGLSLFLLVREEQTPLQTPR